MKLIIQIPCWNEAETLATSLRALPREVKGFKKVEWLIVDDGSTDSTVDVARACGVDHVVRHPVNRGLAVAFMSGLDACLRLDADLIVNTDADNQYDARDIPKLTQPVLDGTADMVIGERPIDQTDHFSWLKKKLQRLGSWAVRIASRTEVTDAPSGFRAISRDTAMRLSVFSSYTYTLETIIQAGHSNLRVLSVPVRTNGDLRPSRLVKSISSYVSRSLVTILRVFAIYRPLALFMWPGGILIGLGLVAGIRFLYFFLTADGAGHIQSVVFASMCLVLGTLLVMLGFLAELIATNRKLLEKIHYKLRTIEQEGRN
ncbi:glycosyltransferase family 2 protein [Luteimonas sp. RD2P54]|uniref:Glycosyltransferase family 2 protein n=1 Tax=Luteimonas endophytica TaxID=3042023 RepID=A0ABT6J832_9GAMM|nr:glycosyltransferase family 2 protein [Luteimonas endophytica]MDH5822984.1 glycosyltransferase family 2 protein [Luteimonas endophytica]